MLGTWEPDRVSPRPALSQPARQPRLDVSGPFSILMFPDDMARERGQRCSYHPKHPEGAVRRAARTQPTIADRSVHSSRDQRVADTVSRSSPCSSHHRRIESLTLLLGKPVEAGVVENAVQPRVERMARRDWQVGGRHPQRSLLARAFAHRPGPHSTVRPSRGTSDFSPTLTTGC
jgi:hypothetical protein